MSSEKCPYGFELGVEYDCHDECNCSGCPKETYDKCRKEARALSALIAMALKGDKNGQD